MHINILLQMLFDLLQERNSEKFAFLFPRLRWELYDLLHKKALPHVSFFKLPWMRAQLKASGHVWMSR